MRAGLRWNAFGLRGRIAGAVLVTAVATLLVAALALLPRLETSLRHAARVTLQHDLRQARRYHDIDAVARLPYGYVSELAIKRPRLGSRAHALGIQEEVALRNALGTLSTRLGATTVILIGYVDPTGHGRPVLPVTEDEPPAQFPNTARAFLTNKTLYGFANRSHQYVRAAIPLRRDDAVLAVYKSIDQIPAAVAAVQRSFEIAALVGLCLTLMLAIPLAAQLVRRLRRLRQTALRVAVEGTGVNFPVDRAHDEIGDLARSFSIMQQRLRHQEEARRAFVATASHELRTPLASLDGMLELLAEDLAEESFDTDDAGALLERARAQSRRLGRLAADLLDLSRIDAEVQLRSEPVELSELSRAVLAEFELASEDRGVQLALQSDQGPCWALGDPGSIARILRILLDNALRVAPRSSSVSVELRSDPGPVLLVRDEGPGVSPEERTLIFERFQRGRDTGGEAGFGLGLAIGRELAHRMGGTLTLADGSAPGAVFELRLAPAAAPVAETVVESTVG